MAVVGVGVVVVAAVVVAVGFAVGFVVAVVVAVGFAVGFVVVVAVAVAVVMNPPRAHKETTMPSEWIKCGDRLPEIGQTVVCFRPLAEESADRQLAVDTFTGRMHESPQGVLHGFDRWCHPTHWMPLPEPPEESHEPNL